MIALEVQLVKPGGHCRGEKEKEEKLGGSCQLEPREPRNTDGGENERGRLAQGGKVQTVCEVQSVGN